MDLGADRRGVDMGPSAMRIADVDKRLEELGYTVSDEGDIPMLNIEEQEEEHTHLKYLTTIKEMSEGLCVRTKRILDEGRFPLILGGDHSMSIGSIAGISQHCKEQGKSLGVVWVDAHPDMNTEETTPSGNIHGMPLAVAMGIGHPDLLSIGYEGAKVDPDNVAMVGLRSIDEGERTLIRDMGLKAFTMVDIDRMGMFSVAQKIIDEVAMKVDHLHISFDVDSVDPSIAKGVGTPIPGGLTYREIHLLMEMISLAPSFSSLEVTEVNPILDDENKTARFAAGVVASVMGQRIL